MKSAEGKFQEVAIPENSSIEIEHLVNTFNYAVFQINETFKKKQQLEKMRKEFVADVSHEFRAPLTSIKGFLEIINDQELTPAELKDCINIMYKDTEYLEHLLSDLLTLGKLESENTKLNKEYISPDILVSRAIKTMKNKLEEKQVNLIMETAEQLPKIHVDVNRVHQVLINLLENALTYSPVRANITIKLESVDPNDDLDPGKGKVKFSIIDEGPGIPENEMDNIWQRFYKIDRARTREQKKGSGLGLAIVKDIILKHGGNVAVKNTPEAGASFMFSL